MVYIDENILTLVTTETNKEEALGNVFALWGVCIVLVLVMTLTSLQFSQISSFHDRINGYGIIAALSLLPCKLHEEFEEIFEL